MAKKTLEKTPARAGFADPVPLESTRQAGGSPQKSDGLTAVHADTETVQGPLSVVLDRDALIAGGMLAPPVADWQIVEQFRQIRRPLIASAFGRGAPRVEMGQLIMLASAMPGEGKSFTSFNLALSIARQRDVNVLLIDADVRKPHISKMLGLQAAPGLLDLLRNTRLEPESLTVQTDVPGLSILPAGTRPEHATDLFASTYMGEAMRMLVGRDPQRLVLLDSSPLLLTTEPRALADIAGQIVVVVCAGRTLRSVLLDALSYLNDRPVVSLILNQSTSDTPTGYYYYGYGESTSDPPDA